MIFFSPCFLEQAEFKNYYNKIELDSDCTLSESWFELEQKQHFITEKAKIFIIENYEKVKDWSNLEINLTCNHKGHSENYLPTNKAQIKLGRFVVNRIANPIETVSFVLDYTDGDLSVTVNGREFWWIEADTVIVICNYIEKQLIKQAK